MLRRVLAAVLIAGLLPALRVTLPAAEIHIAPGGSDRNPGTREAPLQSLHAASAAARRFAGRETVTLHFAAGTYYLPQTLILGPEDSGSAEHPVVYRAESEGAAVLSGGTRLTPEWKASPLRPGVFQAQLPPDLEIDQLYVNGERQWMARFPNRESGDGLNVFDTWRLDHRAPRDPARDPLAPDRVARWADPTGAYFHAMHPALWGGVHWRITGKNADGTLAMEGGTQNNRGSAIHPTYRLIENVREELDAPGEWFHDRATHTLFYLPSPGVDLTRATVETVRLRTLIDVRGSEARPVRGLQFSGFVFRHTARTFMDTKEPMLRSDWTIYRGGAVVLTGTEDCAVADCHFDQVGGTAIFVNHYNRRLTVRGCLIAGAGANGVSFVGNPAAVRNPLFNYDQRLAPDALDRTPGPIGRDFPADCLVEDCLITRTGRIEKQTAGVSIDMARDITIRHCSIYDVPRAGINIGGGTWGGHVVEFCDVFDTVKETGDHGSFNSWGRDRFWPPSVFKLDDDAFFAANRELPYLDAVKPVILRHNRWRCDHGWDIDLDDGSSHYEIRNNLCLRGGIKNREGFGRVVENNVIVRSGFHPHVWYRNSGDIFRRNIVGSVYQPARMGPPPWGAELDHNLLHVPGQSEPTPAVRLAAQSGRDVHSLAADARFVAPERGDFRVRAGSPALALGFVNFPMDRFGVRKPSLKAIARTPVFAPPVVAPGSGSAAPSTTTWLGARVRTLTTIEEASSLGVPLANGGVLVIEVPVGSAAAAAGLQPGDLIVGAQGQTLQSIADLARLDGSRKPGDGGLRIIRDQRPRTLPSLP